MGNRVELIVAPMSIGTDGPFDFRRAQELSKTAYLDVQAGGDAVFAGWGADVAEPFVEKKFLGPEDGVPEELYADKNAVFYRKEAHLWATLDSGKTLYTICRNRLDGDLSDLKKYRPIWIEE